MYYIIYQRVCACVYCNANRCIYTLHVATAQRILVYIYIYIHICVRRRSLSRTTAVIDGRRSGHPASIVSCLNAAATLRDTHVCIYIYYIVIYIYIYNVVRACEFARTPPPCHHPDDDVMYHVMYTYI